MDDIELTGLSDDAKMIAGSVFGAMRATLNLHMQESRPAPRTQAALDELVEKGVLSIESLNSLGGVSYKPLISCHAALRWCAVNMDNPALSWPMYERVIVAKPSRNPKALISS